MSTFRTPLQVEEVSPDRWRLLAPLIYDSTLAGTIEVPAGFVTDLESIPRWVPLAYAYAKGTAKRAAVVHDWLYETAGTNKDLADAVFDEAMTVLGVPTVHRWLMYQAVHWFGRGRFDTLQARARARLDR